MKVMIISDIHGYSKNLKTVLDIYNRINCQELIILGDLLNPRYDREEISSMLNQMSSSIICMRGNNDYFIYSGEFDFNLYDDYLKIKLDDNDVFIMHGHLSNRNNCPFMNDGDILIQGHSHISCLDKEGNKYFLNPGSISLARDHTGGSFIVYEHNCFYLYDLNCNLLKSLVIDK